MNYIETPLLQKIIETWGTNSQIEMIKEECIELALALQKLNRKRGDLDEKLENVIDEIADVTLMLEQAFLIFPKELIEKRIEFKIKRLKERLEEAIVN